MRRPAVLVALAALAVGAWAVRAASIPFWVTNDVTSVLVDWQRAGLSCREPSVGMPGPMAAWSCTRDFEGMTLGASVTADAQGVFGIHVGVPVGTAGPTVARAFSHVIRATSLLNAAEAELLAWLESIDSADGVMPVTATTGILRATVYRDPDPLLFVVPIGSSMLLAE